MMKTMVRQDVHLQPVEGHSRADIHTAACRGPHGGASGYALKEAAAHGEPMPEQAPGRSCSPGTGARAGADFLAGTVAHGGHTLEQSVSEGLYPIKKIRAGAVCEELQPVGRTHTAAVDKGLYPMGGTPHQSRRRV